MAHLPKGQGVFLPPFKAWLASNIPAVYDNTMTYYEELCALIKYLQDVVVPALNSNAAAITAISTAVEKLQKYVEDYFKNLDVQEEINNKLDEMAEDGTLEEIISKYCPKSDKFALFTFFDTSNSNKINFYTSVDMLHLRKLNIDSGLTGRDPSLYFKNGKFYLAVTSYSSNVNFKVYVSEDLQNWTEHSIDLGLYSSGMRIWAPEWFEDDDKLYILLSREKTSNNFSTYIAECTDLESLTFGNPTEITLDTEGNYIDAFIFKENNIYNLVLKEDSNNYTLKRFTSSDLNETFSLVDSDYGKFGNRTEGEFLVKVDNDYYLLAENYTACLTPPSSYYVAKSTDNGASFGNKHLIQSEDDLSHGSGIMCNDQYLQEIVKNIDNFTPKYTNEYIENNNTHLCAFDTYVNGSPVDNYVKLFSIKANNSYRSITVDFNIANFTSSRYNINSNIHLVLFTNNTNNPTSYYTEISEESMGYYDRNNTKCSLFGKIVLYYNTTDHVYDVVLDISNIWENSAVGINVFDANNGGKYDIIYHKDQFISSIGSEVTANIRDYHKCHGKYNNRTLYIDNSSYNTVTITLACANGTANLYGEENGTEIEKIVDDYLTFLNGNISLLAKNSSSTSTITASVVSYTNNVYVIKLSGLKNASGLTLELPDYPYNAILDATYSTEE